MNNILNVELPIIKTKIPFHKELKQKLLNSIESMGQFSYRCPNSHLNISNTDWFLPREHNRPYISLFLPLTQFIIADLKDKLKMPNLKLDNIWFQQYEKGDFHGWHTHAGSFYNCIYYLNLDDKNSKTTFRITDNEFQVDVEEGDVLCFPGVILHCSKENKSNNKKTVCVFNTSLNEKNGYFFDSVKND